MYIYVYAYSHIHIYLYIYVYTMTTEPVFENFYAALFCIFDELLLDQIEAVFENYLKTYPHLQASSTKKPRARNAQVLTCWCARTKKVRVHLNRTNFANLGRMLDVWSQKMARVASADKLKLMNPHSKKSKGWRSSFPTISFRNIVAMLKLRAACKNGSRYRLCRICWANA